MAGSAGPDLIQSGLVLAYDISDRNSYPPGIGNKMNDISGVTNLQLSGNGISNSAGLTWANNVTNITISLLLEKTGTGTGYANHPINKWGATLETTSFVLYHFENYQGNNQDGYLGWYAGAGNAWQAIAPYGFGIMTTGKIWNIVLQYNSTTGGQAWINGAKAGGRTGSGALGTGGSNGDIGIYGPDGAITSKVRQAIFYNRQLTDSEILQNYNQYYKFRVRP